MKAKYWLFVLIIDAMLELATTVWSLPVLHLITKPLLMVLLAGYFLSIVNTQKGNLKYVLLLALFFSWLGDCFLIYKEDTLFFMLGLGSFLLAHIAYIVSFIKFKKVITYPAITSLVVVFIIYTLVLMYVLWSGLGQMKIPVVIYAIVLTLMGITGVVHNIRVNILPVIGVVLFIISDSLIAYTKFVGPLYVSGLLIMATYIMAQFLIIQGLSKRWALEK